MNDKDLEKVNKLYSHRIDSQENAERTIVKGLESQNYRIENRRVDDLIEKSKDRDGVPLKYLYGNSNKMMLEVVLEYGPNHLRSLVKDASHYVVPNEIINSFLENQEVYFDHKEWEEIESSGKPCLKRIQRDLNSYILGETNCYKKDMETELHLPFDKVFIEVFNRDSDTGGEASKYNYIFAMDMADSYWIMVSTRKDEGVFGVGGFFICQKDNVLIEGVGQPRQAQVGLQILKHIFDYRSKDFVCGKKKVNIKGKYKDGDKKKKKIRIREIIYIDLKKNQKEYGKVCASTGIKWSHSSLCPGHWRRLKSGKIGKDRHGVYNQKERTWVIPHWKGEGERINKTRIIKETKDE